MSYEKNENVDFLGVKIDIVNYDHVHEIIKTTIDNNHKGYICVNDVGNVMSATQDKVLFEAINSSLLSLADGTPLAWFAKLAGYKEIERIAGMDIMVNQFSQQDDYHHYLLGDTDSRINRVIEKAKGINSSIQIKGYSPPFKVFDAEDNRLMIDKLNTEQPDIIWVSFGGGKQEKWMHDNINDLDRGIMIGVGAAFQWFLGDLVVPPKILQRMGLQWLFRFTQMMLFTNPRDMKRAKRALHQRLKFALSFPQEVIKARKKHRGTIKSPD
ncbi:MAG: WecB/TagA/CpsF family glycosyltransferase [Geobacteraceae bacterium]|nr:WecB/TagA/CpsF family glycosyltransferase [Geobacteraceae bacterium]